MKSGCDDKQELNGLQQTIKDFYEETMLFKPKGQKKKN